MAAMCLPHCKLSPILLALSVNYLYIKPTSKNPRTLTVVEALWVCLPRQMLRW